MKKILLSLVVILGVSAVVAGATRAYFSDTETSTGNTFAAGTIDIKVDNQNPWSSTAQYAFSNLEPSDSNDINVTLSNAGTNDVVIWKKVKVTAEEDNLQSEPECAAESGVWSGTACTTRSTPKDDLSTQFVYSMNIGVNTNINKTWGVKVSDINDLWIPVGKLAVGASVPVAQNYYFDEKAGNEYQGDKMTVDITFYAEQLGAPGPANTTRGVVLENKDTTTWTPIVGDGTWGILTWDAAGKYTVKAWGLAGASYQLDNFVEPSTDNFFGSTLSGPVVSDTGTRATLNSDTKAKYWLRDLSWSNANTLWEANLVR
jgi:predicted ribosomally synthesized peptide with SipW-like signal peptide